MTVIQYVSRWHHGYSALHAFWQCSDGHYVCLDVDYLYYLQPHALLKHCTTVPGRTRSGWSTVAYTIYYLYIIHHLINVGRGVQSTLHPVNIGVCVCVHACVCMRARVCVCVCVCVCYQLLMSQLCSPAVHYGSRESLLMSVIAC